MISPLRDVCLASLSREELPALAEVRSRPNVAVAFAGGRAWVRWQAGDERLLQLMLGLPGVEFFLQRGDQWHRPGCLLPSFEVPYFRESRPLNEVLCPASDGLPADRERPPAVPVCSLPSTVLNAPPSTVLDSAPSAGWKLVPADPGTPGCSVRALECAPRVLEGWTARVPESQLGVLLLAVHSSKVLVLGERLPALPGGTRYWGRRVLTPLGFRPEPNLPEPTFQEMLGAKPNELALLRGTTAEMIPLAAFGPLTRDAIRRAVRDSL